MSMMNRLCVCMALTVFLGCDKEPLEAVQQGGGTLQRQVQERKRAEEKAERERRESERADRERREKEEAARKEEERIKKQREQALKIISHEVAADKEIVSRYQCEVLAIAENKAAFLKRWNGIEAPANEVVTNSVTIHAGKTKTKTVVKKVELSENQKAIWELRAMFEDDATCSLYDGYTERSAKKLVAELDREWKRAQDDYNNVTKRLQGIDAEEMRERQALTAKFQSERNTRIFKGGRRIAELKKDRGKLMKKIGDHESGRCRIRQMANPKSGSSCRCEISDWRSDLKKIDDEINDLQSMKNAEQSTAVGLNESSRLDDVSKEASRKRAEVNQEYTHQSAVLMGIADKYEKLLIQDLLDFMATKREHLLKQIDEIVARNELKIKYMDGRSELSPAMATAFIDADNRKTMSGLHLIDVDQKKEYVENQRLINTIKALEVESENISKNASRNTERRLRRKKRYD